MKTSREYQDDFKRESLRVIAVILIFAVGAIILAATCADKGGGGVFLSVIFGIVCLLLITHFLIRRSIAAKGLAEATAIEEEVDEYGLNEDDRNEHFSRAVDQLGSDRAEVRIGGVHTIERLAFESPIMRPAAIGTVQGFIDERLSKLSLEQRSGTLPVDIQAAQGVVGRMMAWQAYPARRSR